MLQKLLVLIAITFSAHCLHAEGVLTECHRLSFVQGLDQYMKDPSYKVLFLVRHGHAVQEGKSSAEAKLNSPELRAIDKARALDKKGEKGARKLGETLAQLTFGDIIMFASDALRVRNTALAIYDRVIAKSKSFTAEDSLYYADVEAEVSKRLLLPQNAHYNHAFFAGHGKTTNALFMKLTGATHVRNPTAGVMAVAIKAESWEAFFKQQHAEVKLFSWSPKNSQEIEGNIRNEGFESFNEGVVLESVPGLESVVESPFESFMTGKVAPSEYAEGVRTGFAWGQN